MKKKIVKISFLCAFAAVSLYFAVWSVSASDMNEVKARHDLSGENENCGKEKTEIFSGSSEKSGTAGKSGGEEFSESGPAEASGVQTTAAGLSLSAEGAILIDGDDGGVIYEKNADKKLYPASTTKIMTALIAFDILEETETDLDSRVIIPEKAVGAEGSSVYLKAGEKLTIRELMYGMLLQSGNDAAQALALCCGGTMEGFIERMNRKASELGCDNTNFKNPSGLFDEGHYTTARDLAEIGREAMKNESFREIVSAPSWKSEETGRAFANKNKTISRYEGATGIKIGYTKLSGRTLAASAKRDGRELIAVVLNAPDWFDDAYAMLDYGFSR